ncbi:MAG: hypothetical protein WC712_04015, partial [Candidatus Brocadiia bacterium]
QPTPASAPVVLFLHGFMAIPPEIYLAWIEHLTKSGNIVIHPTYQGLAGLRRAIFKDNCVAGIKAALARIAEEKRVVADTNSTVVVGHSLGGYLAFWLGGSAKELGVPQPMAVFCVEPASFRGENFATPKGAYVVTLCGNDDKTVGDNAAKDFFEQAKKEAPDKAALVRVYTDAHGDPAYAAGHIWPIAGTRPGAEGSESVTRDAYDSAILWPIFDRLTALARTGRGDLKTSLRLDLPNWSDATPLLHPLVEFGDGETYPAPPGKVRSIPSGYQDMGDFGMATYLPFSANSAPIVAIVLPPGVEKTREDAARHFCVELAARGMAAQLLAPRSNEVNLREMVSKAACELYRLSSIAVRHNVAVICAGDSAKLLPANLGETILDREMATDISCLVLITPCKDEPAFAGGVPTLGLMGEGDDIPPWVTKVTSQPGSMLHATGNGAVGLWNSLAREQDDAASTIFLGLCRKMGVENPPDPYFYRVGTVTTGN